MVDEGIRFERYRHYLLCMARTVCGGDLAIDAEDVVQHTILRACEKHADFRGGTEAELAAWLRSILWNYVRDACRRANRRLDEQALSNRFEESSVRLANLLSAEEPTPSFQVRHGEDLAQLAEQLAQLPADQRQAVELRYLQERSVADIAECMQRSTASVAGLLQRGLRDLRVALGKNV